MHSRWLNDETFPPPAPRNNGLYVEASPERGTFSGFRSMKGRDLPT